MYTGAELKPDIDVECDDCLLQEGKDYRVTYKDNVDAGTATIIVTGIGNALGSDSITFEIHPVSIEGEKLVLTSSSLTYNGKARVPVVKTVGGKALKAGVDYDLKYTVSSAPKKAGEYSAYVVGKGNYEGTSDYADFTVTKARAATPKAKAGLVYNGKKQTGVASGKGYTITGNKAKKAGTYTATLTADRNHEFKGGKSEVTVKWKIARAPQKITAKNAAATAKAKKSGKARALAKAVTVDLKKKAKVSAKTKVKFAKANKAGGKKIVVNKSTGKVTLKKGLAKGTYKVKVKLTAAKGANYKAAKAKTIMLTVKVK